MTFPLAFARGAFCGLDDGWAYFDNAGGTQILEASLDAMAAYLRHSNVQTGGTYPRSQAAADALASHRTALARLIGDDRNPLPDDREVRRPQGALLATWGERIKQLIGGGHSVYTYIHNPLEGHSPASVRSIRALVEEQINLPAWPPPGHEGPAQQMSLL